MSENEDENGTTNVRGRPNAYFAQIKAEEEEQREAAERGDTFSGSFRGTRPAPHGGSMHVTPDQIIGSEELCWCGLPAGHDWPGKRVGAKHPKVEERAVSADTGTKPDLDRRDLRAYHRRLQDFILSCVGEGVRYRIGKSAVILYPPDGTTPMSVYARNTDRQLRQLQKWYVDHVYLVNEEGPADEEAIKALAEAKNDPVEHPHQEREEPENTVAPPEPEPEPDVSTDGEWKPYERSDGTVSDRIEFNGQYYRCRECEGTNHPLYSANVRSVGGHNRMYHTDTSDMRSDEARAKALQTKRQRVIAESKVNQAIELLIEFADYPLPEGNNPELEAEVERLTGLLSDATKQAVQAEERAAQAEKKLEESEAKLALIRETMGL